MYSLHCRFRVEKKILNEFNLKLYIIINVNDKMYIHVIYVCFHKWTEQKQLLGEFNYDKS